MERWVQAEEKMVRDGSNQERYLSGFHVLPTVDDCLEYLKKFKSTEGKAIVECWVRGIWKKKRSPSPVYLASEINILRKVKETTEQ